MKDSLKGVRPDDMLPLGKGNRRLAARNGLKVSFVSLLTGIGIIAAGLLADHHDRKPIVRSGKPENASGPVYAGSRMEKFVVVDYEPPVPSDRYGELVMVQTYDGRGMRPEYRQVGKYGSPASVALIGKGGLGFSLTLPDNCDTAPIAAREGRIILVRVDEWRNPDGSTERSVSRDEQYAALCGDFIGRDVARTLPTTPNGKDRLAK